MPNEQPSISTWEPDEDYKRIKELWLNYPEPKHLCYDDPPDFVIKNR